MEITPTTPPSTNTNPPPVSQGGQANAALSSDFETFLVMLTTQLKNQDPLNPIESADFAVQLATFSSVEQQVKTNDLLTNLGNQFGSFGVAQLSGWIGLNARAHAPVVFEGAPVSFDIHVAPQADRAELVVRNAQGAEVQRSTIQPVSGEFEWAGVGQTGAPLPPGTYAISVESFTGNNLSETHPVEIQSRIIEARSDNGQTVLILENGQQISADEILGLSEPAT
jgi:flagellar basal-body rod modification protein FlgD